MNVMDDLTDGASASALHGILVSPVRELASR